jgi:hypothetical protein
MNFSYSKIQVFKECGFKYYLKYVEKYEPDKTFSPLLFGGAIDEGLNYILLQFKDNKHIDLEKAKEIFLNKMKAWKGQNELVYFKADLPEVHSQETIQFDVWNNLCNLGYRVLETYNSEVLPLFSSVDDVQVKKNIENTEGDNLILILDFIATLKDGRKVLFDNKTSSDIKKYYGKNSVKNSDQLALYTDYFPNHLSGYIAFSKKISSEDNKVNWTIVIDKISEEKTEEVFKEIEVSAQKIKDNIFQKNEKSCWSFGKRCSYYDACKKKDYSGLIKR